MEKFEKLKKIGKILEPSVWLHTYIHTNTLLYIYRSLDINRFFVGPEILTTHRLYLCNYPSLVWKKWKRLAADKIVSELKKPLNKFGKIVLYRKTCPISFV